MNVDDTLDNDSDDNNSEHGNVHHAETTQVMHENMHPEVKDDVKVIIPDDQPSPSPVSPPTNFFIIIFFSTITRDNTLLMLYTTSSNLSFPYRSTSKAKG